MDSTKLDILTDDEKNNLLRDCHPDNRWTLIERTIIAVVDRLAKAMEQEPWADVLRRGYFDESGERFVCLTSNDAWEMGEVIEPLILIAIAAARVQALNAAIDAIEKTANARRVLYVPDCTNAIRALLGKEAT